MSLHRLPWALLFLLLLGFVGSRWSVLDAPLFWDELGVYGRASFELADRGASLLPAALPAELSRGHPMLYVYLQAIVLDVFGQQVFVLHAFNLFVALLLLFSVFYVGRSFWRPSVGLLAVCLLMAQPLFRAQATLVLPEVMLALFGLWTVYGLVSQKHWITLLAGCALVLTKETGIILLFALGCWACWQFVQDKRLRPFVYRGLSIVLPLLVFGIFLLVQKEQQGWYLFPYHQETLHFSISQWVAYLADFLKFLFWQQGRWTWLLIVLASLSRVISEWRVNARVSANGGESSPGKDAQPYTPAVLVFLLAIVAILIFSAATFYMNRYMLIVFPWIALILAERLEKMYSGLTPVLRAAVLVLLVLPSWLWTSDQFRYDEDDGLFRQVRIHQDWVVMLQESPKLQGSIVCANFPLYYALQDTRYGYFEGDLGFVCTESVSRDSLDHYFEVRPGAPAIELLDSQWSIHLTMEAGWNSLIWFDRKLGSHTLK